MIAPLLALRRTRRLLLEAAAALQTGGKATFFGKCKEKDFTGTGSSWV